MFAGLRALGVVDWWNKWLEKHPTIRKIWKYLLPLYILLSVLSQLFQILPMLRGMVSTLLTIWEKVLLFPTNILIVVTILLIALTSGAEIFILHRMWRDTSRLIAFGIMKEISPPSSRTITVYAGCTHVDAECTPRTCHYDFKIKCKVNAIVVTGCPPQCARYLRHRRGPSGGGALAGGMIGGTIGLVGGPLGVLAGMFVGGLTGNALESASLPPESTFLEQKLAECKSQGCIHTFELV